MDVQILASILGGLVGGLFTFLGVLITIAYERSKDTKEEMRRLKEKEEEQVKARPRLEIQEYSYFDEERVSEPDLEVVMASIKDFKDIGRACFKYNPDIINKDKWVSVDYVLKNIGATEIDHLYLITNLPKNTSLFNASNNEYISDYKNEFLNYSVILEKTIKPQQTVKIRVSYVTDEVIVSNLGSAPISIWLMDINKNVWSQSLFAPQNKIYNSEKRDYKTFREHSDITTAIECFRNPMMW